MTARTETGTHTTGSRLEAPRFEKRSVLLIAGLRSRYVDSTMETISLQWLRFSADIDGVPGQVGNETYGLTFLGKGSPGIEYVTGVEVSRCADLPDGFSCVRIPAQKYAVFVHAGHVSTIRETCEAIGNRWIRESGHEIAPATDGAPDFFERYTKEFNPQTGTGGIEVWIPIK